MDVNHCVKARVDQMLGDMKQLCCQQVNRDPDTGVCIGFQCDGAPYTKSLKSASGEEFNWNFRGGTAWARVF
jgi:hypothetical protein